MPRSMTGYGTARIVEEGLSVTVELRSVNNRFFDISFKLPRNLIPLEKDIRNLLQSNFQRGRVSIFILEEWEDDFGLDIRFDKGKALKYVQALKNLRKDTGLDGGVSLEHLLSVDNFFKLEESTEYKEKLWSLTKRAIDDAIAEMRAASRKEGENLVRDMLERLNSLKINLDIIAGISSGQPQQYREKLLNRLSELFDDPRLDPVRIETEIAIMADKLDVSEEITRLQSHFELFESTTQRSEPIGKTLSFVLQEMGREVNTIASKSMDIEIGQVAIRMKETLEQVREQVQNLE